MSSSVALNANLEVRPAPGVTIVSGATTGVVVDRGVLRFALGALMAGQRREILFRVHFDSAVSGLRTLASAQLVFESPDDRGQRTSDSRG